MTASDAAATTTSLDLASNGTEPAPDTTDPDLAGAESVGTAPSPEATTTPMHLLEETLPEGVLPFGRIPVQNVQPLVDGGTRPAKSVEHEEFIVAAQVFREGHDAVNATAVLTDPDGVDHHFPMRVDNAGLSWWSATVAADRPGWWTYRVEGWSDPWGTWLHDATIKVEADVDAEMMLEEGARMLERCLPSRATSRAARSSRRSGCSATPSGPPSTGCTPRRPPRCAPGSPGTRSARW